MIAVAIPIAFLSSRVEKQRSHAAAEFGRQIAMWDGQTEVPNWLSDSASHVVLIQDLRRRLKQRPSDDDTVEVTAFVEEGGDGGRWRVRLSWEDAPTVDLLVGFDGLAITPMLIGISGGPHSGTDDEAETNPSDENSKGDVAQ
jgi:hypothetical protein